MFLLLDLWELYVVLDFLNLFSEQMSVHSEPSEVLMATENPCLWGQCRGWLAVQDCPRATPPAEPGLIPAQLHCCLSSQQVLDTGNDCPGSDRSTVPAAASADPEG